MIAGNSIGTNPAGSGAVGNTSDGIEIESGASGNWIGVNTVYGAESADQGNVISGNGLYGILITGTGTSGNTVAGNIVGLTAAGTAALANGGDGVLILSGASANTIGGTVAGARNIISGNVTHGVEIDSPATGNLVEANYIGTDITGTIALGNGVSGGYAGVYVSGGGNTIGGTVSGAGNVIAGSGNYGIRFTTSAASGNLVEGNEIGTNAAGTAALPNANNGINIDGGGSNNTIGGTAAGARNLISGNSISGVVISGSGTTGNLVEGNLVGTDASGSVAVPNASYGVQIYGSRHREHYRRDRGRARNIISGNAGPGVYIAQAGTTGNVLEGDYIGTNSSGTAALGNAADGVQIVSGASGNTIGGLTATPGTGPGNVISGNDQRAVWRSWTPGARTWWRGTSSASMPPGPARSRTNTRPLRSMVRRRETSSAARPRAAGMSSRARQ